MPVLSSEEDTAKTNDRAMELQNPVDETVPMPSILETMKSFISAVEDMDETVLIPSRLRDMPASQVATQSKPVDGNKFSQSQKEILAFSPDGKNGNDITLYSHYAILKALRTELVSGPSAEEELSADACKEGEDDVANKKLQIATARLFRHHLNGVVNTMQQLTLMCDRVTTQYRSEFDDNESCLKPKAFTM